MIGRRKKAEAEFAAEIDEHLRLMTEENVRRGMSPDEAARMARIHFGGVEQAKELQRDERGWPQLDALLQDVRYAARVLRKSPGFTIVSVLTLGLGIGVNATMFNAYNSVALKPLPLKDASEVVRIERQLESGSIGDYQYAFSYPEYIALRDHNEVFAGLVAASPPFFVLVHNEKVRCSLVSGNYLSELGIGDAFGDQPAVVISNSYWTRQFHSDPSIVGRAIQLNGAAATIAGIAPPEFIGTSVPPQPVDVFAPIAMQPQLLPGHPLDDASRAQRFLQVLGRLKPGASNANAATETLLLITRFATDHPESVKAPPGGLIFGGATDRTIAVKLPAATLFGNTDDPRFTATFVLLIALVGIVLLIGCANLANMLMVRASGRQREFAVRLALGSGRWRLVRQLLTESLMLGVLGGVAGLVLSSWLSSALARVVNNLLADFFFTATPITLDTSLDFRVIGYAMAVSLIAGIGFGLVPALRFSQPGINSALKNEGSTLGRHLGGARVRAFLVAGQACVSIVLLICAGLLTRGLIRSRAVRPGFETANAFGLSLDSVAQQQKIADRLRTLPNLRGVALSERIPLMGTWTPNVRATTVSRAGANRVAPEFFATMGVPIVEGRTFTRAECDAKMPVIVVSEGAARQLWPGRSPLGQHAGVDMTFRGDWVEFEVVGVARDVRQANLSRVDPAFLYLPVRTDHANNILFTTDGDNRAATTAVRTAVESVDGTLASSMTLINLEQVPMRMHRLMSKIGAVFAATLAALALSLAAVGIYGVMAYVVSQRVKEIGIRMALGANAGNVVSLVILQGLRPVFIGAAAGLVIAAGISAALHQLLQFPGTPDMLYGLSAFDPATFVSLTLFLALVALLAAWMPARRATRVDPMVALRYE